MPATFPKWFCRWFDKSCMGTTTLPSSCPTSCEVFTPVTLDCLHTSSMSSRLDTYVSRNFFFKSPKHQSGANFVCPASINDMLASSLRPLWTLHIRYHIIIAFLFCPLQLSACRRRCFSPMAKLVKKWCNREMTALAPFPHDTDSSMR